MKKVRFMPLVLCVLLIAGMFTGCAVAQTQAAGNDATSKPSDILVPPTNNGPRSLTMATSYADVFKALNNTASQAQYGRDYVALDGAASTGAAAPAAQPAPLTESDKSAAQGSDYSTTNVQVQGVDEGDIVKTDGTYIYVLRQNELIIFKADGASTARVSSLQVGNGYSGDKPVAESGAAPETISYTSEYASDIYVTGNTAVVITSYSNYMPYGPYAADDSAKTDIAPVDNKQISKVYILDITDRSKPSVKAELGQDGYMLSSRLIGSTLYLISNHYVYSMQEGDSGTYVPKLYAGSTEATVSYKSIAIMPTVSSASYTVIGAYDLDKGVLSSNASLLGGGTTVYMDKDTLYIANSTSEQTAGTPYTDSIYTVIDYTTSSVTDIASFDLTGSTLTPKASGSVPGNLYGQFALDEYNGNLRVATSTFNQSWSEYTDKAKGFVNYTWKDATSANALYVLDGNLQIVGSIGSLAPGEQIYSVRYDGPIGYIVTFRQVDPLFAVDLSDPAKPAVLSALKIPGFSEYLHVYGDGRLFGLGMDADEKTGRTDGMKLTMFDTSDPTDVTAKNSLKLETGWSNALYNHKAILISPDKGIIAFPADSGYDIYGYSDEQGFYKRASIAAVEWSGDSRGLYIGDFAYIVDSASISVLDMTDYMLLNRISY